MARTVLSIRISEQGSDAVEKLAADTGTKVSVAARVLLGEAMRNSTVMDRARTRLIAMGETL